MFKKNTFYFGTLIGLLAPLLLYGVLHVIVYLLKDVLKLSIHVTHQNLMIVSFLINILAIRYYFVSLKLEKTGQGILFVTFIYIIAFFTLF